MKLQLWLTEAERDLVACALRRMRMEVHRSTDNDGTPEPTYNRGQWFACDFTTRRIDELLARLKTEEQ